MTQFIPNSPLPGSYKNSIAPDLTSERVHFQSSPQSLIKSAILNHQGVLSDTGALVINTGKFTGRSPKDKFVVKDSYTKDTVFWNEFNIAIEEDCFERIYQKMLAYIADKELWIRDSLVCADIANTIKLRITNDTPASNLFAYNMFLRPTSDQLIDFQPEWQIVQITSFKGNPKEDGIRSENFSIINFTQRIILIGGTGYTGEIKKSMFTVLNFLFPKERDILSMHCSANIGAEGDTALFFGLSGTGKTTLSADLNRKLIGDDEHGWSDEGVFNFEGGCYAKCIHLNKEKEPQIYSAIRPGALVENVMFRRSSNVIDFDSAEITENTRVSYPLDFIPNAVFPSIGLPPKNIFFLTCDAFGILPPVSRLNTEQSMYHFLSGYTAKIPGTETGISDPIPTFSTCFGAPFLPLEPTIYAELLAQKLLKCKSKIWLINTGWTGGQSGTGQRIKLEDTRSIIRAIFLGQLNDVKYESHGIFGFDFPLSCPGVKSDVLNPANTWSDQDEYLSKAKELATKFIINFERYDYMSYLKTAGPLI